MPPLTNYTVKQGDTLNSISQAAGFTNYKDAGITSVPSGNFDLIRPGEVISLKPAVVSSDKVAEKTSHNLTELATVTTPKTGLTPEQQAAADKAAADKLAAETKARETSAVDSALKTGVPAQPVKSQAQIDAEAGITAMQTQLANLSATMDANAKLLMDGIAREYDSLIAQQETQNRAYQGGINVEGIRSGRERYAPVMQGAILDGAVSSGLKAISDLQAKKAQLLIQAQQARDERSYKHLNDTMNQYRDAVKDERALAQQTYENAMKASVTARETSKALRDDQNMIRDDARAALDLMVSKFGGIDYANLDPVSQKNVEELAAAAGIPLETITGPSLAETSAAATLKRADLANSISIASLRIREATLTHTLQISVTEATALGLPRSVVGMTEAQINADLKSTVVPQWYIQAQGDQGKSMLIVDVAKSWVIFKGEVLTKTSLVSFGGGGYGPTTTPIDTSE